MSKPDNPPAFPRTGEGFGNDLYDTPGMTLRDYFAGQALANIAAHDWGNDWGLSGKDHAPRTARFAYRIADAMLAERAKAT